MNVFQRITGHMEELLAFALRHGLIEETDLPYHRNLLLDLFHMDAPEDQTDGDRTGEELPATAAPLLRKLCDDALALGMDVHPELFSARLMGCVTPSPAEVRRAFQDHLEQEGPQAATDWFYQLCRDCDYIKVDAIAQNIRYFAQTRVGELEITINLSKPEKDPREIAKLKNAPSVGYPRCMLCVENPGYAGRLNFPARQNHRMIPLSLCGETWYLQYSPYAYYDEHIIVLDQRHVPMQIDEATFRRLFAFVSQYPHYMLGSNADLPIVGGSILNHNHFQGGRYVFPMDRAKVLLPMETADPAVQAAILDWPMSTLQLTGREPERLTEMAVRVLEAWREWSDPACGILAREEDGTPHNTITPILRRREDGFWQLNLVLRNNRCSEAHPLGIFHPHAPLHHIKKENIGLIEVMGLFILPGRLKTELALLVPFLTGERPMEPPAAGDPSEKHYEWIREIMARRGPVETAAEAEEILRREVADVCAQVLIDCGVYKQDDRGRAGFLRFLESLSIMPMV